MDKKQWLEIRIDYDCIDWTHLRVSTNSTLTVQDLPEVLKGKLMPFLRTLADARVAKFRFQSNETPTVCVEEQVVDLARYAHNQELVTEVLNLCIWWIEYTRQRGFCKRDFLGRLLHTHWRCPECLDDVPAQRELCLTPNCASWNRLHEATGHTLFRPVVIRGGKQTRFTR